MTRARWRRVWNDSYLWIDHDELGQLSWGLLGGSSEVDDASEMDLSETRMVAYAGVEDIGGDCFVRRSGVKGTKGLTPVVWSDLIDHLQEFSVTSPATTPLPFTELADGLNGDKDLCGRPS